MSISFPPSPTLNQTYTYLDKIWKWNGVAWERSAATETGNVEGLTGEIAYYYEKGSNIQGATAFFYAGDKIGIGTSGPTETLDVRGGITASGRLYAAGGITSGDDITVGNTIIETGGVFKSASGISLKTDGNITGVIDGNTELFMSGAESIFNYDTSSGHIFRIRGPSGLHPIFANDSGVGINVDSNGPQELFHVAGGMSAGGATFDEVTVHGGITASGGLYVGGGATFGGNLGLTGSSFIMFPDGTTQSQGALTRYTHDSGTGYYNDGGSIVDVGPHSVNAPSLFDISSEDLNVTLTSGVATAGPEYLLRYVLAVGSNMPVLDGSSQTWTGANGNIFTTPIGSPFYAGGSAIEILRTILDSSATHMGVTAGEITFKVSGTDILSLDTDIHAHVGISADAGITFGGAINCQDQEVTRPKLKDYSETALATSSKSASFNVDFESGNVQSFTFADDLTVSFTNPPASGTAGTVTLIIANGGANTTTWNSAVKWPGDNAPALTSSGTDIVSFMTIDAGTTIYGFVGGINFS